MRTGRTSALVVATGCFAGERRPTCPARPSIVATATTGTLEVHVIDKAERAPVVGATVVVDSRYRPNLDVEGGLVSPSSRGSTARSTRWRRPDRAAAPVRRAAAVPRGDRRAAGAL